MADLKETLIGICRFLEGKIDILFGLLPYEEEAIRRARMADIDGVAIRMCAPEDLILHKIFSERPHDLRDVEQVVRRRFRELDLPYLEPRIRELAAELGLSSILGRWNALKLKATRPGREC